MTTKGRRGGQGPVKSAPQVTMPSTSTQASHESASTLQTSKSVNTETSTSSGSRVTSTGSSKSKKRRGKTKGLRLAKIRKEGERIHKKFLKFPTLNVALANRPTDIKENDWRYLCNLFSEEKFKERSEINKRNRAKLKTTHTAGTKAFAKIKYDMEQLKELESKSKAEGALLTDEQLSQRVFGRKPGYIIGLGRGPKPSSSASGQRTRAQLDREAFEATQRAEAAEREAAEARRVTAQLAERVQMLESHQTDMVTRLREEMSSQLALFQQQLLERNVPSTSASMQVICPSTEMM